MLTAPVHDGVSAIATGLAAAGALLLGGLLRLAASAAVLFLAWLLADLAAGGTTRLLRGVRFDDQALRAGLSGAMYEVRLPGSPTSLVAGAVRWFVRVVGLLAALDTLGVPTASVVLVPIALWLPNTAAAFATLLIGGLAARAVSRLVRGSVLMAGISHPDLLANLARAAVWAFAGAVALTQLGIAADVGHLLFAGIVAALALAFGLAAGLGGQEVAGALVASAYRALQAIEPESGPTLAAQVHRPAPPATPDEAPPHTPRRRRPMPRRRGLVGSSSTRH